MSKLFEEAVADARLVQKLAIENAKMKLQESFTKEAKAIVNSRINEEDESLFTEEEEGLLGDQAPVTEESEISEEMDYEDEKDSDLDEIIKELEDELKDDEGDEGEEDDPEEVEVNINTDDEGESGEEEEEEEVEEGADMEQDDSTFKRNKDMIEAFLEKVLAELRSTDEAPVAEDVAVNEETDKIAQLEEELAEAKKIIKLQSKTIKEAAIINAKLLYTGNLFKSFNLSESQKVKILEQFDRAASVRESKLLYVSIQNTLKELKDATKNPKMPGLTESIASRPSGRTNTPKDVLEKSELVKRFQTLAGITNEN